MGGSLEDAMWIGVICRLCSRPRRSVVFIFGAEGRRLDLLNKINSYLPIRISQNDDLPKTICEACLVKILQHHQLIERIQQVQRRFLRMRHEMGIPVIDADEQPRDPPGVVALAPESPRSSRTLSVDSAEPAEEPMQDPTADSSNTQQTTRNNGADGQAASSGMPNAQSNAINDGASTSRRTAAVSAVRKTGRIRRRRRQFRVGKIVRKVYRKKL